MMPEFYLEFADLDSKRLALIAWGLCAATGATLQVGGNVVGYEPSDNFKLAGWGFAGDRYFVRHEANPGDLVETLRDLIDYLTENDGGRLARFSAVAWPEQRPGQTDDWYVPAAVIAPFIFGPN